MKVTVGQQRVSPVGMGGTSGGVRAGSGAFGASLGQAGMMLGKAVQQAGGQIAGAVDSIQLKYQSTNMLENLSAMQDEYRAFDNEYRSTRKGKDAGTAFEDYSAKIDELNAKYRGGIGDGRVLSDWDSRFSQFRNGALNSAAGYGRGQMEAWQVDTLTAGRERMLSLAEDPAFSFSDASSAFAEIQKQYTALYPGPVESVIVSNQEAFNAAMGKRALASVHSRIGSGDFAGARRAISGEPPDVNLPPEISVIADAEAEKQGVSPALVRAVIMRESGGDAAAVSSAGAKGPMQLMDATARDLGVTDPFDAAQNIRGGVGYLKTLLERYDGDESLALMAYNWGMGNVDSFVKTGHGIRTARNPSGGVPEETRAYVEAVLGTDEKAVSAYLPPEKKAGLTSLVDAEEKRVLEAAAEQAVEANYGSLLDAVADFPTLAERKTAMTALIAQVDDEETRKALKDRMTSDFQRMRDMQDGADMAALLKAKEATGSMLPSRIYDWMATNWSGSEEGRERALKELTAPPEMVTAENKEAFNALMVLIDNGEIADSETLDATAWQMGLTGKQTADAQKWMDEGGRQGKVYSMTVTEWRRLNPGKKTGDMPVDLPEMILRFAEEGKPLKAPDVRRAIATLELAGEYPDPSSTYAGYGLNMTVQEAIEAGPDAVAGWKIDEELITDRQRDAAVARIRKRGQEEGLTEEQMAGLLGDEELIAETVSDMILRRSAR